MKKNYFLILIALTAVDSTILAQTANEDKITGNWSYCDKYTFKYLSLNEDDSFSWYYSSCKGDHSMTGNFIQKNDTLILTDYLQNKVLNVLIRDGKLYSHMNDEGVYPDFEPFIRTNKKTQEKAQKKCGCERNRRFRRPRKRAIF